MKSFGSQHPEDYTLFLHGTFDCDNATWEHEEYNVQSLGNGVDFVEQQKTMFANTPDQIRSEYERAEKAYTDMHDQEKYPQPKVVPK